MNVITNAELHHNFRNIKMGHIMRQESCTDIRCPCYKFNIFFNAAEHGLSVAIHVK